MLNTLCLSANNPQTEGAEQNSEGRLSLRECIGISLSNSPEVKISEETEYYMEKGIDEARSAYWPKIYFTAEALLSESEPDSYPGSINARWDIFDMGRRSSTRSKAEEYYLASQWQKKLTAQDIIYRAAGAYVQRVQYEEIFLFSQEVLAEEEKRLETAKARSREGLAPELDTAIVEAQVYNAKIELSKASSNLKKNRVLLNDALGLDLNAAIEIEAMDYASWSRLINEYNGINRCLDKTFLARPDYKIAEHNLKAAEETLKIARAEAGPDISFKTDYYLHNAAGQDNDFKAGLVLDIPLFEGGLKKARIEKAKAQVNIARLEKEKLKKKISKQLSDAHEDIINLQNELSLQEKRLALLFENLEAQKSLYNIGRSDITKLNEAHQDYTACRLKLSRLRGDILSDFLLILSQTGEIGILTANPGLTQSMNMSGSFCEQKKAGRENPD